MELLTDCATLGWNCGEGQRSAAVDLYRPARIDDYVPVDGSATGQRCIIQNLQAIGEGVHAAKQMVGGGINAIAVRKRHAVADSRACAVDHAAVEDDGAAGIGDNQAGYIDHASGKRQGARAARQPS